LAAEGLSKTTTSATSSSTTKTTKTSEKSAIEFAVQALKRGSVIAVPTDTLYGFACDASNAEAIENLYAVKGREKTKPVAVCVSRAEEVKKICELDGKIEESLLRKLLPGAVTLLFKRKWTETTLSKSLNPNVDNVGVRVPDCAFILDVCDAFDGAIALTSANTSGKPSCVDVNEFRELHEKCERVFDGGKIIEDDGSTDSALLRAGSTIVDLSKGDGTFHVVRDGCALTNTTSVLLEYGFIESK
jgi:tRNA threonylcarbamoyl adenosine modification protein (Sua5/YciO/YrdC/YwlC family)